MGIEKVFLAVLIGGIASLLIDLWMKSREDRKQVEEKKKHSVGICPICGEPLVWQSDCMASECGYDTSDGDYIVSDYECLGCDAQILVRDCGHRTTVPTEE